MIFLAFGNVLVRNSVPPDAFGVNSAGSLASLTPRPAPHFQLTLYDGSPLRIEDLQGQGVILNFWASWCVPCRDEAPVLVRAARDYDGQSVKFLGVGVWDAESDARAFMNRFSVRYPSGPDEGGRIAIEYGLTGVPETFFIRSDGTMVRRWVGPINDAQLRAFVDEIRP
ncbi:MAG: resA [Chloroflexi bacterium]|nr:resA [Chloroflexota bacterium]